MSVINKLLSLITGSKNDLSVPATVKFYKDAAQFGEHGRIVVTSPKYGLKEIEVAFVFAGQKEAPELTLETHKLIVSQAYMQGFVPLHIVKGTYGVNPLTKQ